MSSKILVPKFDDSSDNRPLPERIATLYQFALAFHDDQGTRLYSVQDWIKGIVPSSNVRNHWNMLKRRNPQLYTRCVQLPYKARDGKSYKMDFADAETLYLVTQRMEANSGNRDAILVFLAKAGVVLDVMVRNPDLAEAMFAELADEKEYRSLLEEGYSPEDARQWVMTRRSLKEEWNQIKGEWGARGVKEGFHFARLTNDVNAVATGKTATQMKRSMQIKTTPRDYLSAADNAAIQITTTTSRILHHQRDSQGVDELSEDVKDVKPIIDAARPEIDRVFNKQPRRLPSGTPKRDA